MKNMRRITALALLALVLLASCNTARGLVDDQAAAETTVDVRNRHWLSMEIYVMGASERVRLGRLTSGETKVFVIPAYLLAGATPLRFVMESSGPSPVILSEEFTVAPGDEVLLVIPNMR